MDKFMDDGNFVIDFHSCEFFPERYFDLVVVLRTQNDLLFPRLEKRGYSKKKIQENIESEIFQVVLDEAKDSYNEHIVLELQSNSVEDMENNLEKIKHFVENWNPTMRRTAASTTTSTTPTTSTNNSHSKLQRKTGKQQKQKANTNGLSSYKNNNANNNNNRMEDDDSEEEEDKMDSDDNMSD
jgi:hypothetical protein